jgi:hypothetical protein
LNQDIDKVAQVAVKPAHKDRMARSRSQHPACLSLAVLIAITTGELRTLNVVIAI